MLTWHNYAQIVKDHGLRKVTWLFLQYSLTCQTHLRYSPRGTMKRQSYSFYGYYYFVTMANEGAVRRCWSHNNSDCVLKAAAVLGPRLFFWKLNHRARRVKRNLDIGCFSFISVVSLVQKKRETWSTYMEAESVEGYLSIVIQPWAYGPVSSHFYMILAFYIMGKGVAHARQTD